MEEEYNFEEVYNEVYCPDEIEGEIEKRGDSQ